MGQKEALVQGFCLRLQLAFLLSWQSHITNESLYDMLPGGNLGCQATVIDKETLQGNSFSGNPTTGTEFKAVVAPSPLPPSTLIDTLNRDVGTECTNELSFSMKNQVDWQYRCEARLWLP